MRLCGSIRVSCTLSLFLSSFSFYEKVSIREINKRIQTHIITLHTNQHSALTIKQTNVNMDRMKEKRKGKARIGVFSVGYDVYWAQFPGLLEELLAKEEMFIRKFPQNEVDIIRFGMIDSPAVAYKK